jgi:hypothetical protein
MVTVDEYFQRSTLYVLITLFYLTIHAEYKINLRYKGAPLVDVGAPGKPTYLPAEVCSIEPGEPHYGRLLPDETSKMLLLANRRPAVNAHHITLQGLPKLGLNDSPILNEFGITVSQTMAIIPARELNAPGITYGAGSARASNGASSTRALSYQSDHASRRFLEHPERQVPSRLEDG